MLFEIVFACYNFISTLIPIRCYDTPTPIPVLDVRV
jgi:hypothetical protein